MPDIKRTLKMRIHMNKGYVTILRWFGKISDGFSGTLYYYQFCYIIISVNILSRISQVSIQYSFFSKRKNLQSKGDVFFISQKINK